MKKIEPKADRGHKKSATFIIENQRVAEICRLLRHRYGGPCRTDEGVIWLEAVAPTQAVIVGGIDGPAFPIRMVSWAAEHVPLVSPDDIAVVISEARDRNKRRRLMLKAEDLGNLLNLTVAERQTLRIRTIRQAGVSDHEMKALKRARDAERKCKSRQRAGAKPRSESLAQKRPWEAAGLKKSRWYELQKLQNARTKSSDAVPPDGAFQTDRTDSSAIDLTSPSRTNLSDATTEPVAPSRADSTTRKRRRSTAASGWPANDNHVLKPYRPKRGKRMALVGSVNDNGTTD